MALESQDVNCVEGIVGVAVIVMGVAVMGMVAVGVAIVGMVVEGVAVMGVAALGMVAMGVAIVGMVAVGVAIVGRSFTCVTDVSIVWRRSCCQPPGSPARSVASLQRDFGQVSPPWASVCLSGPLSPDSLWFCSDGQRKGHWPLLGSFVESAV